MLPREVAYEDLVTVTHKVTIYEQRGGSGHGEGGRLVVPTLPSESDMDPVDHWLTVNVDPCLDSHKVAID